MAFTGIRISTVLRATIAMCFVANEDWEHEAGTHYRVAHVCNGCQIGDVCNLAVSGQVVAAFNVLSNDICGKPIETAFGPESASGIVVTDLRWSLRPGSSWRNDNHLVRSGKMNVVQP